MSTSSKIDFRAATWLARVVNQVRFMLRAKNGKHRSYGISTFEWVRMNQVARDC